jgi:hypothetical protein
MPSANKTPNYNLTQYSNNGSDKISALKDYNEDMLKIDTAITSADTKGAAAVGTANAADGKAGAAQAALNALGAGTTADATALKNTISSKAPQSSTYTKDEVGSAISSAVNPKANKTDVYTTTQVDSKINALYTKAQVDTAISTATDPKANKTGVYTKTEADSRFVLLPKAVESTVVIGDSISYGTGASSLANSWANKYAAYRSTGANTSYGWNFSQNNAGYINGGAGIVFNDQLTAASNNTSFNNGDVTHVLIVGGANDKVPISGNNVQNAAVALFRRAQTIFPNAKIIAVPCLLGIQGRYRYHLNINAVIGQIEQAIGMCKGIQEIPFGWEWLNGNADWSADYAIHPNDAGNMEILKHIAEGVDGGVSRCNWIGSWAGSNGHTTIKSGQVRCVDGMVTAYANFGYVNNVPAYEDFAQCTIGAAANINFFVPNSKNATFYVHEDGNLHLAKIGSTTTLSTTDDVWVQWSKPVGM